MSPKCVSARNALTGPRFMQEVKMHEYTDSDWGIEETKDDEKTLRGSNS